MKTTQFCAHINALQFHEWSFFSCFDEQQHTSPLRLLDRGKQCDSHVFLLFRLKGLQICLHFCKVCNEPADRCDEERFIVLRRKRKTVSSPLIRGFRRLFDPSYCVALLASSVTKVFLGTSIQINQYPELQSLNGGIGPKWVKTAG